jgi:hypothetical protein
VQGAQPKYTKIIKKKNTEQDQEQGKRAQKLLLKFLLIISKANLLKSARGAT